MKKSFLSIIVLVSFITFAGCEASKGAGKDIENTGKNLQEAVQKNQ